MKRTELRRMSKKRLEANGGKAFTTFTKKPNAAPSERSLGGGRIKPKRRTASEFNRIYGSRARVAFVKRRPCAACVALNPMLALRSEWNCDNAHTESGGKGRKADCETIAPLCREHHRAYDEHRPPCDHYVMRTVIRCAAADTEAAWQAHCARTGAER